MFPQMGSPGRKPTVTDIDILREFVLTPDPVLHPTELTDPLDLSRQGVHNRLQELAEKGDLASKKVAGTRIFWITESGRERVATHRESE